MSRRLGAVLAACLVSTACSPGEEGQVVVGKDDKGQIVVVLGICTTDRMVTYDVAGPPDDTGPEYDDPLLERTRVFVSGDVGRFVLQTLPGHGTVTVGANVHVAKVRGSTGEGNDHHLEPAQLDLANVPDLPPDADELARSYC